MAALAAFAPLAHAQIHRCVGAHGEPEFSGQPCGTATPGNPANDAPPDRWGNVCAASRRALAQEITDAFQTRDVNLLAGLILWRGTSQATARASLRALAAWLKRPLVGISMVTDPGPPRRNGDEAVSTDPQAASGSLRRWAPPLLPAGLEVATDGEGDARYFGLAQIGACWWLTL